MQVRENELILKPRVDLDITRSPTQGYQWPQRRTDVFHFFLKNGILWVPFISNGRSIVVIFGYLVMAVIQDG